MAVLCVIKPMQFCLLSFILNIHEPSYCDSVANIAFNGFLYHPQVLNHDFNYHDSYEVMTSLRVSLTALSYWK